MWHSSAFYVDYTIADVSFNLQMEFDRLKAKERRVTATMVAEVFNSCGNYGRASIKQTSKTCDETPKKIIDTIRTIANRDDPEICLASVCLILTGSSTVEENSSVMDCRLYSKFLCTSSLKALNALRRLKA